MSGRTLIPPECNWPGGHEWEGNRVRLPEDDGPLEIVQECRWCYCARFGVPVYEVAWSYEEEP